MEKTKNVSVYDIHSRIRNPIVFSMLQIKRGDKVLDLGSGTGYFSEKICKENTTTFCLDIALDNLLSIKKREKKDLFLINSGAEKLPLKNELFDKILCSEVLEHIQEDKKALKEIARILRPGGIFVITVPCSEFRFPSLINILGVKTVHDYEGPEKHYRKGYTVDELSEALSEVGLVVSEHRYFSHFFSKLILDIISLSHLLVRKIVMGQKAWNWADIQNLNSSTTFTIYKFLFPLFLLICKLDNLFYLSSKAKGCGVALKSKKFKNLPRV